MKKIKYLGVLMGITAMCLAWLWFGWKLSLVLFLALAGNNMEQNN